MGGSWSSQASATLPQVESISVYPSNEVMFSAPLALTVLLARDSLRGMTPEAPFVEWILSLEVDIAHLQAHHVLLTASEKLVSNSVTLHVPSSAFETVALDYSPDQLANICVLHVVGNLGPVVVAKKAVVVDVFLLEEKTLRRKLYGALAGTPKLPSSDVPSVAST
jgi:hypothetical protein